MNELATTGASERHEEIEMDEKLARMQKMMVEQEPEALGAVIYGYSREQAIEDGVLIDVTDTLKARGYFQAQICLTSALWEAIQVPERSTDDLMGRVHDVLQLGQWALRPQREKAAGEEQIETTYKVKVGPRLLTLYVVWNATEGVTIGFPEDF